MACFVAVTQSLSSVHNVILIQNLPLNIMRVLWEFSAASNSDAVYNCVASTYQWPTSRHWKPPSTRIQVHYARVVDLTLLARKRSERLYLRGASRKISHVFVGLHWPVCRVGDSIRACAQNDSPRSSTGKSLLSTTAVLFASLFRSRVSCFYVIFMFSWFT